jgi:hypothetical protein
MSCHVQFTCMPCSMYLHACHVHAHASHVHAHACLFMYVHACCVNLRACLVQCRCIYVHFVGDYDPVRVDGSPSSGKVAKIVPGDDGILRLQLSNADTFDNRWPEAYSMFLITCLKYRKTLVVKHALPYLTNWLGQFGIVGLVLWRFG